MLKPSIVPAIIAALILLQTLFFKFKASPESVALLTALGVEPFGRIATGVFELIAAALLIVPATRLHGGIFGVGLMFGATASHIFIVRVESNGDEGILFVLAFFVLIFSLLALYFKRPKLINLRSRIFPKALG